MNEFEVGDDVEILTNDGKSFVGRLQDFTEDYFVLWIEGKAKIGGILGFPFEDVARMDHA